MAPPPNTDPNLTFGKIEKIPKEFGLDLTNDCPANDIDMDLEDPNFEQFQWYQRKNFYIENLVTVKFGFIKILHMNSNIIFVFLKYLLLL